MVEPTPLKNHGVQVSWDDDFSQYDGKNHPVMFQTTKQQFLTCLNHRFHENLWPNIAPVTSDTMRSRQGSARSQIRAGR